MRVGELEPCVGTLCKHEEWELLECIFGFRGFRSAHDLGKGGKRRSLNHHK